MQTHEYTVVPAPSRGEKARGARTGVERFAYALTGEINRMAAAGWEYVRAETLPCEERSGLTSRTTVYHNVLVFRRALARTDAAHPVATLAAAPVAALAPAVQAAPAHEPPAYWPDGQPEDAGPEDTAPQAAGSRDANFDEPPLPEDEPGEEMQDAPPFARRPPLAASKPGGIFSEPMQTSGTPRLGPAKR
ncbi:MAG TPA: DUF4177 domain-containing protein [Paracoccus sp. (in: a-proteobacteria)]|nr:DUF4177 domain-containing protein [Paracoccus sp. (in: a-proteobacteria)]